jgi:hypothetical protein
MSSRPLSQTLSRCAVPFTSRIDPRFLLTGRVLVDTVVCLQRASHKKVSWLQQLWPSATPLRVVLHYVEDFRWLTPLCADAMHWFASLCRLHHDCPWKSVDRRVLHHDWNAHYVRFRAQHHRCPTASVRSRSLFAPLGVCLRCCRPLRPSVAVTLCIPATPPASHYAC